MVYYLQSNPYTIIYIFTHLVFFKLFIFILLYLVFPAYFTEWCFKAMRAYVISISGTSFVVYFSYFSQWSLQCFIIIYLFKFYHLVLHC